MNDKIIKICGITDEREAEYLNEAKVDYAGFIQYFPKSKRNISLERAHQIMKCLDPQIQPVAVTVSPTIEQIRDIESAGFSAIQIHGDIDDDVISRIRIPVIRAFNVHNMDMFDHYEHIESVVGYVMDAQMPGSGKTFDWSLVEKIPRTDKMVLLAGGLEPSNVAQAIELLGDHIDGVDTSSGVENDDGIGKNKEKIMNFVHRVRKHTP